MAEKQDIAAIRRHKFPQLAFVFAVADNQQDRVRRLNCQKRFNQILHAFALLQIRHGQHDRFARNAQCLFQRVRLLRLQFARKVLRVNRAAMMKTGAGRAQRTQMFLRFLPRRNAGVGMAFDIHRAVIKRKKDCLMEFSPDKRRRFPQNACQRIFSNIAHDLIIDLFRPDDERPLQPPRRPKRNLAAEFIFGGDQHVIPLAQQLLKKGMIEFMRIARNRHMRQQHIIIARAEIDRPLTMAIFRAAVIDGQINIWIGRKLLKERHAIRRERIMPKRHANF